MNMNWKWIVGVVLALVVIISGAVVLSAGEKPPVEREKMGTATLAFDQTQVDLGTMRADEEKTAKFVVTNTSDQTLRLWNVTTSCSCTFATIKIGESSPVGEFNMHEGSGLKNWLGEVPARGMAEIAVTYRPRVMPVVGKVERQVLFATNDPNNQQVQLTIQANVL